MLRAFSILFASACLAASMVPLRAQIANSAIVGRVMDPAQHVVANVDVELRRLESNETFRAKTTETGDYTATGLPLGTYDIKVAVDGFKTEVNSGLKLDAGQTVRADFLLQVGAIAQRIEVEASTPALNTETPVTGVVYDSDTIARLPNQALDVIQILA